MRQFSGLRAFSVFWVSQLVSILATQMSNFALTVWAYEVTGQATALALVQVFFITPFLLVSPIAGVMVDRYNRKAMMMLSDLGGGVGTLIILALQAAGALEVWHLYATAIIFGLTNAFQWPAQSAAISVMVDKAQFGRVNGMMSLLEMGPSVVAPLLAGALFPIIGLVGILWLDVVTFVLAVGALLFIRIPQPPPSAEGQQAQGAWWQEALFGFRYLFSRPSLLGLQMVFFFGNLFSGIGFTVLAPMILARTANDASAFGLVQSVGAAGGIMGGVAMSAWGGFKRRVHGVLLGWLWTGVFGMMLLGFGREVWVWALAMFLGALVIPLLNGSNQAIYQAKVPPDIQGRVFTARRLIAWLTNPITPLIAGPLADWVLEPAMRNPASVLAQTFGPWVGVGPGTGMALIFIFTGVACALVGLAGYLVYPIRNAESILPDFDAQPLTTDH